MPEILEVYDLENNLIGTQTRDEFYKESFKEYQETGAVTRKVKTIRVFVMNSEGHIYLQKRSKTKTENSGLYDKTIGGHIPQGESPSVTVIRECAEELGFPAAVIPEQEFERVSKSVDLSIIGVLKEMNTDENFLSKRETEQGSFIQPYISHFYIGYYDGAIRFRDGESSGIETFSLEELQTELNEHPEKFTADLQAMILRFQDILKPLKN